MFLNGYWRNICDDGFSSVEATVACRQLGFSGLGNSIIDIINNMCILIQYLCMFTVTHQALYSLNS